MKSARGLLIVLLVAVTGAALTLAVQQLTSSRIASQQRELQSRVFLDALPISSYDNQPLEHPLAVKPLVLNNSQLLNGYLATLSGQPSAVLLRSQTTGYGGSIELLIVIASNGKLLGVKTLKQSETPSLGGHISEAGNPWLSAFQGLSRSNPQDSSWALKKDNGQLDQMAGATITSRAVINAVHDALRYFDEHRQHLLEVPARD
ncbi:MULTISPECIES: RnfABCDGE type electron transport complex subunit G [unclassified Pseudomonas]|uniref:RnfABCDGE type electron transport complex subunit G n=1 Tax=unclassified Pseudomonas TaxID=196821 RepID=UPI0011ECA4F5|nr:MULTISPECIES: RnfABCDGE type electron transport complex subunit G [unclassified Pseudomonas]KAA0946715.1 RnfABCDGE type electron transport complex subunit G [Pseudomonas sp. ANT_H4]KAA0953184.1 RnfABCDGE type electron transport complex subunit G [Pseudomonas sp. ANT_H14]